MNRELATIKGLWKWKDYKLDTQNEKECIDAKELPRADLYSACN